VFSISGVLGLVFLLQTLHRLTMMDERAIRPAPADAAFSEGGMDHIIEGQEPSALDMPAGEALGQHTRKVFGCWVIVFGLVGAQMGWVLRPFIGNPNLKFTCFRPPQSNFFEAVITAINDLLAGG
jgi:hypothetical protein